MRNRKIETSDCYHGVVSTMPTPYHIVYVENVHNYPSSKCLFVYHGSSLSEMMDTFYTYYPKHPNFTFEVSNLPRGYSARKVLVDEVIPDEHECLHVFLKVNQRDAV